MPEKYLNKKKKIYFAFLWSMRKLGIDEWIVRLVKVMYDGANSRIRVNSCFSERFEVTVGLHQGSVLSPVLFAIVMEALSRECRIGCPWELLYANNLRRFRRFKDLVTGLVNIPRHLGSKNKCGQDLGTSFFV